MDPNHLRVFYGQAHDTVADVYVEIETDGASSTVVGGEFKGPYCSLARTLPAVTALRPLRSPDRWKAQIVDPCFWSPDHPAVYRLRLEFRDGRQITPRSEFGIRRLGCDRQQLRFNGRRWVLRAAGWPESVSDENLAAWHDGQLAMLVRDPTPSFCQQASELGVMLVVWLDPDRPDRQLQALSRWAAVAIGILQKPPQLDPASLRRAAPNLLLGQWLSKTTIHQATEWADLLVCGPEMELLSRAHQLLPARNVISWRPVTSVQSVAEARGACELLQRNLAPRFDLSGYLV